MEETVLNILFFNNQIMAYNIVVRISLPSPPLQAREGGRLQFHCKQGREGGRL